MKRDMDLARSILLAVEADDSPFGLDGLETAIEGADEATVGYHIDLLIDAGLVVGDEVSGFGDKGQVFCSVRLTWTGHEFIDAARDDTRWNRAKTVAGRVGGVAVDVLAGVLSGLAVEALKGEGVSL